MDGLEIVEAIRVAFADVRRGGITLHEAEVIDAYGSAEDLAAARRVDTEDSWEQVPDEAIEQCTAALSHLDPESWRFYIPAYMTWALKHSRDSDSLASDFTIYTFALDDEEGLRRHQLARYATLSELQSVAVCRFLRFMAANGDYADDVVAQDALHRYWGKFCAEPGA